MNPLLPVITNFTSAGTLFTNGTHVLAAYQKDIENPTVSGIGGKRENSESYIETALREMVEELFGIQQVPLVLLRRLVIMMEPRQIQQVGSYVLVVYSFNDLDKIIETVCSEIKVSPLYSVMPKTITDLVLGRKVRVEPAPEIFYLSIIPMVKKAIVDVVFIEDIQIIMEGEVLYSNPI